MMIIVSVSSLRVVRGSCQYILWKRPSESQCGIESLEGRQQEPEWPLEALIILKANTISMRVMLQNRASQGGMSAAA
jgi:hypothetical protein